MDWNEEIKQTSMNNIQHVGFVSKLKILSIYVLHYNVLNSLLYKYMVVYVQYYNYRRQNLLLNISPFYLHVRYDM